VTGIKTVKTFITSTSTTHAAVFLC